VSFQQLVQDVLSQESLGASLSAFRAELMLCATIVVLLLVRMLAPQWKTGAFYVMLSGTSAALLLAIPFGDLGSQLPSEIFTGLLVFDAFAVYMRMLLLLFALLFTTFTQVSGVPDQEDAGEFYVLVLGATLGMCLMVSANHMLIVFLGVEMASVPSYVLAGLLRHRRTSSEAALKYAVFGAGTAGVMLYGISLLVGALGSAHLPTMALRLAEMLMPWQSGGAMPELTAALVLGGLMVMVGLSFKLSAVPFHFWAPDVFEGATAEVAAFLSIASKAAALALLVRLSLGLGTVDRSLAQAYRQPTAEPVAAAPAPAVLAGAAVLGSDPGNELEADPAELETDPATEAALRRTMEAFQRQLERAGVTAAEPLATRLTAALDPVRKYLVGLIALIAAITCTFGNLAAYGQTNIKRLLAYSTIAHAGYMMMAVAAAVALIGDDSPGGGDAIAALAFYVAVYLFMNLGAFAAVAFLRNALQSEAIDDYAGLVRTSPGLAVCLAIILFSLVGLPPLAGFAAKFAIFSALVDARLIALLVIGGLNTVLSLFYYLRVVKVVLLAPMPEDRPAPEIPLSSTAGAYCAALTAPVLLLGVWWGGLFEWTRWAASAFFF